MEVTLVGSTNGIKDQQEAKRFVQNHARICYTDKDWGQLLDEEFKEGLMRSLIGRGHHSPLDHVALNFYLSGSAKVLAMTLNNQGMYTTSEKSARYTVMKNVPPIQRELYGKWDDWFLNEISRQFPEEKFKKLHAKGSDGKTTAEKLAQENA
ncbi:MAG: FAD-dependent thymidylate synthase, partial [Nanoarchaeota archaeon]|nr:FAD-dependent thymidylate synthase [Nanoarchaeota archaeon]